MSERPTIALILIGGGLGIAVGGSIDSRSTALITGVVVLVAGIVLGVAGSRSRSTDLIPDRQSGVDRAPADPATPRPSLAGLGTQVEQVLRLAEKQADDYLRKARAEADEIVAAARAEAARINGEN